MLYTLSDLCALAAYLEPHLVPIDVHVAAGGSCLHKGGSDKDIDLFLYPHNKDPGERAEVDKAMAEQVLKGLGFKTRCVASLDGSSAIPNVWCAEHRETGTRVDFIFLAR